MALGGYKFRGFQCAKGSLTDTQWALLLHKTRLKAFVEANAAAGSQWAFNKTGGDISFETYGDVIYEIDNSGYNYISFLKYGNEDYYFIIISMFNQTADFNNTASGYAKWYGGSMYYMWSNRSCFHVAATEEISTVDFMLDGNAYPDHALPLFPITSTCAYANSISKVTPSTSYTIFDESKVFFGYAIRGKEIACLASCDRWNPSGGYPHVFKQCFGFDSMTLSSQNDTKNLFAISLDYDSGNSAETDKTNLSSAAPLTYANLTLNDLGYRYNKYNEYSGLLLSYTVTKAIFSTLTQTMPFEAPGLFADGQRTNTPYLNTDGITSKGSMNVEFLAMNGTFGYNYEGLNINGAYADGNYLLANRNTQRTNPNSCAYYIGWDPSNPNILTDAAWTVYTGE